MTSSAGEDELAELRAAVEGLTYPSESDEPFDVFRWPVGRGTARNQVVAHGGAARKVVEVPVDRFFGQLETSEDAERYRALRRVLESTLAKLKAFRVGDGEVRVDVYLTGKLRGGTWAGVHTVSVET
jgi:hypothetical protein